MENNFNNQLSFKPLNLAEDHIEFAVDPAQVAKVRDVLPVPTTCRHCGSVVKFIRNEELYGHPRGNWPFAYLCQNPVCGASIGLHKGTDIPLGTLAKRELKAARYTAKQSFLCLVKEKKLKMNDAYEWLAYHMNKPQTETHFGFFEHEDCQLALKITSQALGVTND